LVSDLFPFRFDGGWETHYELLNVPALIDPERLASSTYVTKIWFFNEDGRQFHQWQTENHGLGRRTINISDLVRAQAGPDRGTFSCFHQVFLPQLEATGGFLTERGYTGYANTANSRIRGYVHGNLDAVGLDDTGRLTPLGKGFLLRRGEYRLQHRLEGPATYEFCIVNSSRRHEAIEVELLTDGAGATQSARVVPSRGSMWAHFEVASGKRARVIVRSRLNLPRPVVFRVEATSFDVFHG
jgi:hypothetical protein